MPEFLDRTIWLESPLTWLLRVLILEALAWFSMDRKVFEIILLLLFSVVRREDNLLLRACARDNFYLYFCNFLARVYEVNYLLFFWFLTQRPSSLFYKLVIFPISYVFSFNNSLFIAPIRVLTSAFMPLLLSYRLLLTFLMMRATSSSIECSSCLCVIGPWPIGV